jgi:uncharacterized coiled-coil protein SlyX
MSDKEKMIEELRKQIAIIKQEIRDKELVLSSLIEQLENMDNN